jgi:hypothetical protein
MARRTAPVSDPARPTRAEVRRWQEGHRRAARKQRALIAIEGVDRRRALAVSTDLFDVALTPGAHTILRDAVREREVAAVREIWRRLRARHAKHR